MQIWFQIRYRALRTGGDCRNPTGFERVSPVARLWIHTRSLHTNWKIHPYNEFPTSSSHNTKASLGVCVFAWSKRNHKRHSEQPTAAKEQRIQASGRTEQTRCKRGSTNTQNVNTRQSQKTRSKYWPMHTRTDLQHCEVAECDNKLGRIPTQCHTATNYSWIRWRKRGWQRRSGE